MSTLLVKIAPLQERHRREIAQTAANLGWQAVFADQAGAMVRLLEDVEALFTDDLSLVRQCTGLRWLHVPSAGVEPYLQPGVLPPDALLSNSSGAYGVTIAEHIVMVTLMLMRRQPEYEQAVAERRWERGLSIRSIKGSRITLLGTGDIGTTAARRLRGFEPDRIVGVCRSGICPEAALDAVYPVSELDRLLPETDLLVVSLPGTPHTRKLLDVRRLALLPRDSFLVNVGRGSVMDQEALLRQMQAGHLAGAALDVFEEEPIPRDSGIWTCPRLLVTPHISGNMTLAYTVDRITALFLENFTCYAKGSPLPGRVSRNLGY